MLSTLAGMTVKAAERCQVWVVTHSELLAAAIHERTGARPVTVMRRNGETAVKGE